MVSFIWLEWKRVLPTDLGATWNEVDPCWDQAMLLLKAGYEEELARALKR